MLDQVLRCGAIANCCRIKWRRQTTYIIPLIHLYVSDICFVWFVPSLLIWWLTLTQPIYVRCADTDLNITATIHQIITEHTYFWTSSLFTFNLEQSGKSWTVKILWLHNDNALYRQSMQTLTNSIISLFQRSLQCAPSQIGRASCRERV